MPTCRTVLKCSVASIEHMCALQTLMRTRILFWFPAVLLLSLSQTVQVSALVLEHLENTKKTKYASTRAVVMCFGGSAKKTLPASPTNSTSHKERLEGFYASKKWAKNFVVRSGLASKRLRGEAGGVNPELIGRGYSGDPGGV